MERIAEQEPMVRRAMTVEDIFIKNEEERHLYELREKGRRDYTNAMLTSELRGKQEGLREGKQEGKQEGLREAARSMLAKKTPIEFIQEVTGLSEREIQSLR